MRSDENSVRPRGAPRAMAACLLAAVLAACAPAMEDVPAPGVTDGRGVSGTVWDVAAAAPITPEELARRLSEADLALIGEVHDNPVHHERQAWLVRRMAPAGLAFEMVPSASEDGIQAFMAEGGAAGEIGPAIGWEKLGWPEWDLYRPIFEAAPDAYFAGGGVSRSEIGKAFRQGAAVAYGPGSAEAGLDAPFAAPVQAAAEAEMLASHCDMLPPSQAAPMVEAQRLRDARFAAALLRAAESGGGQAVLITGNGHVREDRGVPANLAVLAPGRTVVTVGQVEVAPDAEDGALILAEADFQYDYVWFSDGVEDRPDPCEAFRKS